MKAKRKPEDKLYDQLEEFLTYTRKSDTRFFSTQPTHVLEEEIERLKKSLGSSTAALEQYLERFEEEAREVLAELGYSTDLLALADLKEETPYEPEERWELLVAGDPLEKETPDKALAARQVLYSAKAIREAMSKKDAPTAAIEMIRLSFAGFYMNFESVVDLGLITMEMRRHGGGQRKEGILLAIEKVLKSARRDMSAEELWLYFKRNHPEDNQLTVGQYEVWFYRDIGKHDLLFQNDGEKEQSIKKHTFRRYVYEVKKALKGQQARTFQEGDRINLS